MLIWALFAAMTAVALTIVLWPIARRGSAGSAPGAGDAAVYRDQLAELDRDLAEGRLAAGEAEAARAEIGRRLIRATRAAAPATTENGRRRLVAAVAAVIVVPAVGLSLYLGLGRPDLRDRPLAARLATPPERLSVEELVARVERRLAEDPEDARGWELVAPIYLRLGRADDAVTAFRNAIRIAGPDPARQNGLGEALIAMAGGRVVAEAKQAFEVSLTLAPKGVLPQMYLALERSQVGRFDESAERWRRLVAGGRDTDPWMPVARSELAKAEAAALGRPIPAEAPVEGGDVGPTAADIEAAGEMSTEERGRMIESMVARLDERLRRDGGAVEDWARLVRSLRTIGKPEAAADALARARSAHAGNAAALARLDALLGIH
jgi:cytochrome c-type biogenesis protein CcmH